MAAPIPQPLARIYKLLAATNNLAADGALAAALPQSSGVSRRVVVETLLERGRPGGLTALVARFQDLDESLRSLVLKHGDTLPETIRRCVDSNSVEQRVNAIELIQALGETGLAYLLSTALTRSCARTRTAAATTLLSLTRSTIELRESASTPEDRRAAQMRLAQMADATKSTLDNWPAHFRNEVLTASILLCDGVEKTLFSRVSSARSHLAGALNDAVRANTDPAVAGYALRALANAELRAVAAGAIASRADQPFVARLMEDAWVTYDAEVAKACAWIKALPWVTQSEGWLLSLRGRAASRAVRLIALSGLRPEERWSAFRRMVLDGSPDIQEAALCQVIGLNTSEAVQLLRRVAGRRGDPLSRIASHELFRRDPEGDQDRSPKPPRETNPPPVAAGEAPARPSSAEFEAFWDGFQSMDDHERHTEGRRLGALLPNFAKLVGNKLVDGAGDDRLQGLVLIRAVGLTADFEDRIYALSHDPDARVRSTAVAMLSQIEGATALRILRQALNDPDGRVKANAVEGLAASKLTDETETLARALSDANNRVQANAIKALLQRKVREAAVALLNMLRHPSSAHRISGLWVVDQLRLIALEPRARQLATIDPDPRVRERADQVLRDVQAGANADLVGPTAAEVGG